MLLISIFSCQREDNTLSYTGARSYVYLMINFAIRGNLATVLTQHQKFLNSIRSGEIGIRLFKKGLFI